MTDLEMRTFDPAQDAGLLHGWVTQERARFWMMSDYTVEEVREVYEWIDAQDTHAAYLVLLSGNPVALFQTYDPRAEEIGQHFDVQDGDLGFHLLMGPADERVPGLTAAVIDRIVRVAADARIPLQVGVTSGGTDASAFNQTGAIDVGLSWPGRYSHSPVEVMDRTDVEALITLIVALATGY